MRFDQQSFQSPSKGGFFFKIQSLHTCLSVDGYFLAHRKVGFFNGGFFIRSGLMSLKIASLIEILCVKFVICNFLPIIMEIKPSKMAGIAPLHLN